MVRKTADSPAQRVSSFEDIERAGASPPPSQNTRSTQGIRCETTPVGSPHCQAKLNKTFKVIGTFETLRSGSLVHLTDSFELNGPSK
ncbi:hypothetical protein J6590_009095 [Homalodisca vitripennis]|nr:hypothetical protein J6590_009095 [Homalodisca vitripennis]